ncbi:hypothetical protein EZS27_029123 [termite gut metagenome]|uniref:Uncharacterized protein n=1 Tax=termite gut metagenome TaxID=433724 RepID=A0A5J4QI64_9ZZZZ
MSKSIKHTPIFNWVICQSNKYSKKLCNRKFRRYTHIALSKDKIPPVRLDEVMTEYDFKGDGKFYYRDASEKDMRK